MEQDSESVNHGKRLEHLESQFAEFTLTNEFLAETVKKICVREHLPGSSINQLPQKGTMSELVLTVHWHYIWRSRVSPDTTPSSRLYTTSDTHKAHAHILERR